MKRIINIETTKYLGEKVKVCGWVNTVRSHGGIIFLDMRDRSGVLQVVCNPNLVNLVEEDKSSSSPFANARVAKDIKEEDVLEIEGEIKERPIKMVNSDLETGRIELQAQNIKTLSKSEILPFDLRALNLSLPTLLDHRPLTFKNQKIKAIFKIQEEIINSFRKTLKDLDFTEFQAPAIVPSNAEGGAEVFRIDYYNYDAYLAQSPQLYKQIMVAGFERVFTVNHVFRAEPSVTTRHLSEYISLDAEMSFINSWEELMDTCEMIVRNIFSSLKKNYQKELKMWDATVPELSQKIPRLKMRQAQEIIFQRTKRDNRKEPDLSPEDEKEICNFAKEKYGSELIFITHYPTKKRPFYTYADLEDPEYTLSFDLLFRGLEIITGGQRINEYKKVVANIKKWGNHPKDFKFYLQAFKYGMPPEGGFAWGLERVTKQILGLKNIREATLFPRDMERIDQRLSLPERQRKVKKRIYPLRLRNKSKKTKKS